jgi:hypothetical protein
VCAGYCGAAEVCGYAAFSCYFSCRLVIKHNAACSTQSKSLVHGLRLRRVKNDVRSEPRFPLFTRLQVAIVSFMAALAQLSLFTSFMVGDKCDLVNKLLKEYVIPVFLHLCSCQLG